MLERIVYNPPRLRWEQLPFTLKLFRFQNALIRDGFKCGKGQWRQTQNYGDTTLNLLSTSSCLATRLSIKGTRVAVGL